MIFLSMGLGIQACAAVLLWSNLMASQSQAAYLIPTNDSYPPIHYTIINFNGKQMNVSWEARKNFPGMNVTMFYTFDHQEYKQCPRYIFDQGNSTGCLFKTDGEHLSVSIKDAKGENELYWDEQDSSEFFKPNPPENVTFQWTDHSITIQYNPPNSQVLTCLALEMRYKSTFDNEWQVRKRQCCSITDQGFDSTKCYYFQFKLSMGDHCSNHAYSSEWGVETVWKNGTSVDSCAVDVAESYTVILLATGMTVFLIIFVVLVCVCRLERIRNIFMPTIPDPKNIYSDLFSDHNGNFQDWMSKTENVLAETKLEYIEEEFLVEEEDIQGSTVECDGNASSNAKHQLRVGE